MMRELVVLGTEQGVLKSPPCPGLQVNELSNHGASHLLPTVVQRAAQKNETIAHEERMARDV